MSLGYVLVSHTSTLDYQIISVECVIVGIQPTWISVKTQDNFISYDLPANEHLPLSSAWILHLNERALNEQVGYARVTKCRKIAVERDSVRKELCPEDIWVFCPPRGTGNSFFSPPR